MQIDELIQRALASSEAAGDAGTEQLMPLTTGKRHIYYTSGGSNDAAIFNDVYRYIITASYSRKIKQY